MRKIKEILRLKYEQNLSHRAIATSLGISAGTVSRYAARAKAAGLGWPLPEAMDEISLESTLFKTALAGEQSPKAPDCQWIHQELKRKGVTLFLLWQEYKGREPNGYGYSRFCQIYRDFKATLSPTLRQSHKAGEKLFVDYSGLTVPWTDSKTGEVHRAELFVAVLGASNYTFVRAYHSQSLPNWIDGHVKAFAFFGGVVDTVVPDNLRSGVSKAHIYDPDINPTYQDMAIHYQVAIVPARARAPKDKAKAENGVQGIQQRILAPLRHRTFFSVEEINAAIMPLLTAYNERPLQKLSGTRRSQFELLDQPKLKALPACAYEFATWKKVKAGMDYHISHEQHYYSVPHQYLKKTIDCRLSTHSIECFFQSKRIAHHRRSYEPGHTTLAQHMPKSHREYVDWTPEKLTQWATQIGKQTTQLISAVIAARPMPQQGFRACLGILRLSKKYGNERLEKAACRALQIGALRYQHIESMLKHGFEQFPIAPSTSTSTPEHSNVRGRHYFQDILT